MSTALREIRKAINDSDLVEFLPKEQRENITDIALIEPRELGSPTDLKYAKAYTGLRHGYRLADLDDLDSEESLERLEWLFNFYRALRKQHDATPLFRFEHEGHSFRGKRRKKPSGEVRLTLRHIPAQGPRLPDLAHPPYWHDFMMMKPLLRGGIVLICAPTGNGKTTTLAGMWKSRLEEFGGVGVTVEEPVEIILDGEHGHGDCVQTEVDLSLPKDERYPAALADILTEFPTLASGGGMLMVGELRESMAVKEVLTLAQTGLMVAATVHAASPADAVQRVVTLAGSAFGSDKVARELVAANLRCVFHQQMVLDANPTVKGWKRGVYTGDMLFSANGSSKAARIIRDEAISGLVEVVNQQNNLLEESHRLGESFERVYEKLEGNVKDLELG